MKEGLLVERLTNVIGFFSTICNWPNAERINENIESADQCRLDKESHMKRADLSVQNTRIRRRKAEC